jgi:hypothetical protein
MATETKKNPAVVAARQKYLRDREYKKHNALMESLKTRLKKNGKTNQEIEQKVQQYKNSLNRRLSKPVPVYPYSHKAKWGKGEPIPLTEESTSRLAILNSLNKKINPATRRSFKSGPTAIILEGLKKDLRKDPENLDRFWNQKKCPSGAVVDGKCYKTARQLDTIVRFFKVYKAAQKTNKRPVAELKAADIENDKKNKANERVIKVAVQRNKAGKRVEEVKANLAAHKKLLANTEVLAYTRKKNLDAALARIKKLEENGKKVKNNLTFASEQRNSLLGRNEKRINIAPRTNVASGSR